MKLRIDLIHGVLSIIFKAEANNKTRLKIQLRFKVSSNYKLKTGSIGQPITPCGFTGPCHAVFWDNLSASPIKSLSSATSLSDGGRAHVITFRLLLFSASVLSKCCFYKYFEVTLLKFSLVFNKGQGYGVGLSVTTCSENSSWKCQSAFWLSARLTRWPVPQELPEWEMFAGQAGKAYMFQTCMSNCSPGFATSFSDLCPHPAFWFLFHACHFPPPPATPGMFLHLS